MTRATNIRYKFVDAIPSTLDDGVLYVSLDYHTALHLCCCGCCTEVVTPLSPTDWRITCDGETVSVCPSIGNWSFACRSHYWIDRGCVVWAEDWSKRKIERGREHDRRAKRAQFQAQPEAEPGQAMRDARARIGDAILRAHRKLLDSLKGRTQ